MKNQVFDDANTARAWLESQLWTNGPVCSHCKSENRSTPIRGREGVYQCNVCRKQFTVTVGTPLEHTHVPLNKWLLAAHLVHDDPGGMSPKRMHLELGVSYKTALQMMRRLSAAREAGTLPLPSRELPS